MVVIIFIVIIAVRHSQLWGPKDVATLQTWPHFAASVSTLVLF